MSKSKKPISKEITSSMVHGPYTEKIEAQTKHGTTYRFFEQFPHNVEVKVNFHINLDRLDLIEDYCDLTWGSFHEFVKEAIYEKMDREVREPDLEGFKRNIIERFQKKWDTKIQNRPDLQDHINSY